MDAISQTIFWSIFLNENVWKPIKISLKFVPKGPINNIPALVQIMAWRRSGDKPLSKPMMVRLPTQIFVTRPQWVKKATFSFEKFILSIINYEKAPLCMYVDTISVCNCSHYEACQMIVQIFIVIKMFTAITCNQNNKVLTHQSGGNYCSRNNLKFRWDYQKPPNPCFGGQRLLRKWQQHFMPKSGVISVETGTSVLLRKVMFWGGFTYNMDSDEIWYNVAVI